MAEELTVTVTLETAILLDHVYLPVNVSKIRTADPLVIEAVRAFKAAIATSKRARLAKPQPEE